MALHQTLVSASAMASLSWLSLLPAIALLYSASSSAAAMAPAFIWSNTRFLGIEDHSVDYQIFTPQSLVDNLFQRCHYFGKEEGKEQTNSVLAFLGHELRSVDIARDTLHKADTLHVLKNTVAASNFSVVLPYVHFSNEENSFADMLVETIQQTKTPKNVLGELRTFGCTGASRALEEFGFIHEDIEEFFTSKKATTGGQTTFAVVCGSPMKLISKQSEGEFLGKILQALSASRRDYVAFYVSDLSGSSEYASNLHARQLSSSAGATNVTFCDGVCQAKATLLEALLVGIVLIIILVAGICCMAGVQAPSKFEVAKES